MAFLLIMGVFEKPPRAHHIPVSRVCSLFDQDCERWLKERNGDKHQPYASYLCTM